MNGEHTEAGGLRSWLGIRYGSLLTVLLFGCATPVAGKAAATPRAAQLRGSQDSYLSRLQARLHRQDQRVAELEARLTLLEQEARQRRAIGQTKLQHSVTLGQEPMAVEPGGTRLAASDDRADTVAEDTRPPIRLRLHGGPDPRGGYRRRDHGRPRRPVGAADENASLPAVPVVDERLPIAPLPAATKHVAGSATGPARAFRGRYVAALSALQSRRYRQARTAFGALLGQFPGHRLSDKVLYWRGEAAYAMRDYRAALSDFQVLAESFPQSSKRPEGLYKASLCLQRLGQQTAAAGLLAQVRSEYPESEVAQLAAREGAR